MGPPDGARVAAVDGRVTLGWRTFDALPSTSSSWQVQITAQGRPWFSGVVNVPWISVAVPAGPLYRWRAVSRVGGEATPWHTFQVVSRAEIDFRGEAGAPGRDGFTTGNPGERGGNGGSAVDLEVWVDTVDGYVRVRVESARGQREVLHVERAALPVRIRASGGNGGPGGRGANGMGAEIYTPGGPVMAAGPGAMGGDGGDGGSGARVRLHASVDAAEAVRVDVSGGDGGRGGVGGGGSIGAPGPNNTVIYGPPGASGAKGRDGRPGSRGQIIVAP